MPGITITGGRVLRGGRIAPGALHLRDGEVVERPRPGAERIDARGALVLPGIVDLHGDAFERQIMPRPGVRFDLPLALIDTDRQMLASGITTAYHGLSVSWEPGLRSLDAARALVAALAPLRPRLGADTRLHIRWETFAHEAVGPVAELLAGENRPILAFNDHTTLMFEGERIVRPITAELGRSGLPEPAFADLLRARWAGRARVPGDIAAMAALALAAGATLMAHDEPDPAARARFRALGARISEFPLTRATAQAARDAGEHVVLGAPNVLRGGSHIGALGAAEAAAAGLCTVLASDYYYPALLQAPFRLAAAGALALAQAWELVSANPADAAGLADRGRLEPGCRADVLLVDDADPTLPAVRLAIVAGRVAAGFGG